VGAGSGRGQILESNSKFDHNKALVALSRLADRPFAGGTGALAVGQPLRPVRGATETEFHDRGHFCAPLQKVVRDHEVPGASRGDGFQGPPFISRRAYSITASMTELAWRRFRDAATSRAPTPISEVKIAA
jgi:hypothetical protein